MVELCLMASHGYPLGIHSEHVSNRLSEEFHHFLPHHGSNQELINPLSLNLSTQQKEELRSNGGLLDSNHFARIIDSTSKRPLLVDFQDSNSDSVLLSFGIAERCVRYEKVLKLLSSKPIEEQRRLLDLSMLYDLMGPQSSLADLPQQQFDSSSVWYFNDDAQPLRNLIHPNQELYLNEPFLGPLSCNCTGTEMNGVLSVISDFYTSKNTNKSSRQTMLVPYFERRRRARANIGVSKLAATETASLKSHAKAKTSQKKKTNARLGKERDIYNNSYLHACESLLSMIVGRKQQEGKNVILSMKKSGPQLPHLLTQVSASIAGTGIAVILSVLCRISCSRVPFCGSRVLSTGLGLGLVWLSWAVNKLRDTVITISKNYGRAGEMELHVANRKKLLDSFRDHLSRSSRSLTGYVFLQGGEEQTRHCTDHIELFRQESYFAYLFGVLEPGFYGAIDIASGESLLFAPRLPADYAVWLGEIKPLSHFKEIYMVSSAYYTDEITKVLHQHHQNQGPGKPLLYLLHGLNSDSNNFSKPADFEGIDNFKTDLNSLHPILTECRVIKSALELSLIQFANDISSEAHVEVMRKTKVGMKEYQQESLFLHHTYMYGGCRHCSYTCICATGVNSSVLHYGHAAAPNDRTLEDGDMALLDMGAEYHFYGSDITCSFPVNGKFTHDQSLVYNAVLRAHNAVISSMRPGVSWIDMHKLAERIILESLKEGHLLSGDVDAMAHERLGSVFMPHGLGHLLGIDTHDPGGYLKGAERPKEPGLKSLRMGRELLEGMVITVEPGCYFIDALLLPAMENTRTSKYFNHEQISRFRSFGGVRIESDLHVTSDGCVNMTKCPREVQEIEAVMAGAPWSINKTTQL